MNDHNETNAGYPEFTRAWDERSADIDQQIIDCCSTATEQKPGLLDEIGAQVSGWWDKQTLDTTASAEWAKFKADTKLFNARVENRLQHLIQNGKIAWAKATEKA